jgi:hypothetical protein
MKQHLGGGRDVRIPRVSKYCINSIILMTDMNLGDKQRLDRIEEKIDKMTEAVIALARAEEKISNLDQTTRMILQKMVDQDERLRKVEEIQHDNEATIKTIKSIVWTTVSALITTAVATLAWLFTAGPE